jgi:cytochrome d ubiquinol oxidase subunit II
MLTLTVHGALWVVLKTEEETRQRARRAALGLWWGLAAMTVVVTAVTFRVQPHIPARLNSQPWGYIFPLLAVAGLFSMRWFTKNSDELKAFLASCLHRGNADEHGLRGLPVRTAIEL